MIFKNPAPPPEPPFQVNNEPILVAPPAPPAPPPPPEPPTP